MFCHIVVSETDIFPFPSSSSCTSVLRSYESWVLVKVWTREHECWCCRVSSHADSHLCPSRLLCNKSIWMGGFISAWCYWLICERLFRVSKCSIVQRVQYRTLHESLKILSWWEKLCFACVKWRSWKRLDNETFSYPTVHFRNTLWFADTKPYYQPRRLIYSTVCLKTWLRHSETASFYSTTKSLRQKRKEKNWLLLLCWGRPRILSST